MTNGSESEQVFAQYLDKARPYWRLEIACVYVLLIVPMCMLGIIIFNQFVLYPIGLCASVLAVLVSRVTRSRAKRMTENEAYYLVRHINSLGATHHEVTWRSCCFHIGEFKLRADLLVYAQTKGERGLRCVQFPKLTGSMRDICGHLHAYGLTVGRCLNGVARPSRSPFRQP